MQSSSRELYREDTFDHYFEQTIPKSEISAILYRLQKILNFKLDDDNNICDKQKGPEVVQQALAEYTRKFTEITSRLRKIAIYSIATICFYYWIKDSELVAAILTEAFACHRKFSIFEYIKFPNFEFSNERSFTRQSLNVLYIDWTADSGNFLHQTSWELVRKMEESATVYFIHHAHKAQLHFLGLRFVDFPVKSSPLVPWPPTYLAAVSYKPRILMHFLRFGANVNMFDFGLTANSWKLPMLLRDLLQTLWLSLGNDLVQVHCASISATVMSRNINNWNINVVECLRILLRVIPQIPMNMLNFHLWEHSNDGHFCCHEFVCALSQSGLIPNFVNRYLEPSELRHLCRCVVRDCLNKSWNLPYGVNLLPVPVFIKHYLSIQID